MTFRQTPTTNADGRGGERDLAVPSDGLSAHRPWPSLCAMWCAHGAEPTPARGGKPGFVLALSLFAGAFLGGVIAPKGLLDQTTTSGTAQAQSEAGAGSQSSEGNPGTGAEPGANGDGGAASRGRLDWPSAWQPTNVGTPEDAGAGRAGTPGVLDGAEGPPQSTSETSPDSQAPATAGTTGPAAAPAGATPNGQGAIAQDPGQAQGQTRGQAPGQTASDAKPQDGEAGKEAPAAPAKGVVNVKKDDLPAELKRSLQPVSALEERIDTLEKRVERVRENEGQLNAIQPELDKLVNEARSEAAALEPRLANLKLQLDKLGPAPNGDDAAPESAEIASERARINTLIAAVSGAIKKAELVQVRARQLTGRILEYRQALFTDDLFRRTASPLLPSTWTAAFGSLPEAGSQITAIVRQWLGKASEQTLAVISLIAAAVTAYLVLLVFVSRAFRKTLDKRGDSPSEAEKVMTAGWYGPVLALPLLAASAIVYFGLDYLGLLYLQMGSFALVLALVLVLWEVSVSLAQAYLQPSQPNWRIAELDDRAAKRLYRIVQLIALTFVIDYVVRSAATILFLPLPVSSLAMFATSLLFALALFAFVRTRLPAPQSLASGLLTGIRPELLKLPVLLIALAVLAAAFTGYIPLARYISGQATAIGSGLLLSAMTFLALRAISEYRPTGAGGGGARTGGEGELDLLALSALQSQRVVQVISYILYAGLSLLIPALLLFAIGFSWTEISSFLNQALFGFEIGGFEVSLIKLALAAALFAGIVFGTGLVQRGLSQSVLAPGRVDAGLGNSIRTGIGYIGFAIATLVGLSYVGLDITNLAIVAGALSVGIGFGLQSIVNNFVSGLILLVERPIKVGDWIRAGGSEGHVRRISVRSTEVETFDRASVIIPNSELITGTVINLTHRNALGRVVIRVGVTYKADPVRVQEILLEAAEACDLVAKHPAPFVVFEDFGANSLDFSVRIYLSDINRGLSAQTQLRTEIFKRLKANDIEIPYPQMDFHLRDLDGIREMLAKAAQDRLKRAAAEQEQPSEPSGGGDSSEEHQKRPQSS